MAGFPDMIRTLENYGISDVLLPFILVFTIVFAILQKTQILGEKKKNFNVIISLVMSFGVVIPHVLGTYPPNGDVVNIINQVLPQVSLGLIAILMVLIMLGILGADVNIGGTTIGSIFAFVAMIFILGLFATSAGWINMPSFMSLLNDPEIKSLITIILVFGIIVWFITSEPTPSGERNFGGKLMDAFKELGGKR